MKLSELPKLSAYSKATKRRGKGVGSGQGKTAGRGHKGGKARAGYSPAPCCCGIPFYRHFPMRGFSNFKFRVKYVPVNLADIAGEGVESVDKNFLHANGYIRSIDTPVKILGTGEFSGPITIIADKFSASARASIEKSGGQAVEFAVEADSK
ncbi:MAG: 50S ribosomal protein L15 [Puniceicoccales bacterium]|jgi:large subunit ribosomal protein L15|nr:50S ribosomal protein L15 [Puniceicoccales bacterium]